MTDGSTRHELGLLKCHDCGARTAAPIPVRAEIYCGDCYAAGAHVRPADPVNHPAHYNQHPSGVECITITEHMGFNLGNAIKYIWRADLKGDAIEDLEKAAWYISREIRRRAIGVHADA